MPKQLRGVLAIAHAPFDEEDEIDLDALKRSVDWAFSVGADGIGTGMVTETSKLHGYERDDLSRELVEYAAGRGPVFVSVAAESTNIAVYVAQEAEHHGCDAVMALPPLIGRSSEAQLVTHFCTIADSVRIPMIVQDASGYVGQSIPMGVYVKLLERYGPDKILFKPEAAPNGPNISALRDATGGRARIFEGSGGVFLIDSFRRGIAGTMPGMDLLDGIVKVWQALDRGDQETAYRIYFPICAIVSLQLQAGLDGFLAIEKHLMVKRGLFSSARRRTPYDWELDAETADEVDRLFDRMMQAIG